MTDLADFLLARLDEDESALPADDSGKRSTSRAWWSNDFEVVFIEEDRWRAEIEAKRRIVELHKPTEEIVEWFDAPETGRAAVCPSCHPAEPTPWNPPVGKAGIRPPGFVAAYVLAPCPTLRLLALPYADHPGYRQEWRP